MKNKKLFYYRIIMESLIFVIFNLFHKKKDIKSLVHTIWVIEICPFFESLMISIS